VTHRIDVCRREGAVTFEVQGLLDAPALAALEASVAAAVGSGSPVRVVLKIGTDVDRTCLPLLRALHAEVVAESPYLARWIAGS
jgi:hypothetical protein